MDEIQNLPTYPRNTTRKLAIALARAFLAGEGSPAAMRERGKRVLGRSYPWLGRLISHLHLALGSTLERNWQTKQHDQIVTHILAFPGFLAAFKSPAEAPQIRGYFPFHASMRSPRGPLAEIALPSLATPGDLADWLEISPAMLDWYANTAAWNHAPGATKLDHYHYRWVAKARGGVRLIEAPKENLRIIQRRILREILDRVPVHEAAHGCVRGRSVVSNARLHSASPLLLKLDLQDFFISIPAARVHALFRTLGYPQETARYLTGLSTHSTPARRLRESPQEEYPSPEELRRRREWARQFMARHLPQGAPTSPALANLCAYRLDLRLSGLARKCQAKYSRYVDDLVFSCTDADPAQGRRILTMAQGIILEEGFVPNWRKTRMAPASTSQRITGLVVNERPNLPRREFDTLKAILTNCRRHGPASQNRLNIPDFRAHLLGRLSWFRQVNAARGERLKSLFDQVRWN